MACCSQSSCAQVLFSAGHYSHTAFLDLAIFVNQIGSFFCSCNLILILHACNVMAQQTIKCDLKTDKHVMTRHLSNEHNTQEQANILQEFCMAFSLNLVKPSDILVFKIHHPQPLTPPQAIEGDSNHGKEVESCSMFPFPKQPNKTAQGAQRQGLRIKQVTHLASAYPVSVAQSE